MSKNCPNCGCENPDEAKFCFDCGCDLQDKRKKSSSDNVTKSSDSDSNNIFSSGKIFLVLIAVVIIIGIVVIFGFGSGDSNDIDNAEHVDLTIKDVSGWDSTSGKKSYTLYTEALFNNVPSNLKGYNIKTTYIDANGSEIGYEIEKLDDVYYDSSYALTFGHYTTYKLPDPDHVNVEIIKDGKTIDNYTAKIDQSKIDYLN